MYGLTNVMYAGEYALIWYLLATIAVFFLGTKQPSFHLSTIHLSPTTTNNQPSRNILRKHGMAKYRPRVNIASTHFKMKYLFPALEG